jgi:hypothetical protein
MSDSENGPARATIAPPTIEPELLAAVQRAYDERRIVGIVQPRSKAVMCSQEQIDGDLVAGCSALAVFRHIDEHDCPSCGKKTKEQSDEFCLAHTALKLSGTLLGLQTSIFEGNATGHDHDLDKAPKRPGTLDGKTGAPADAASYPMVPASDNAGFCVCGYALTGPVGVNHDRRHAQFLAALAQHAASKAGEPAADLTKHVSRRGKAPAAPTPGARRSRAAK